MTTFSTSRLALTLIAATIVTAPALRAQDAAARVLVDTSAYYNASVVAAVRKLSIVNPMEQLITGADTLDISAAQVDSITAHNTAYVTAAAKEWGSLQRYLAAQPKGFKVPDVMPRIDSTYTTVLGLMGREAAATKAILTAVQMKTLPAAFVSCLEAAALPAPAARP